MSQAFAQANQAPTVSLTSPTAGAEFDFRSNITLTADAADGDGTITQVRFYRGTTLLGTSTQAPYSFTWANVAGGSYNLTARATDNSGAVTTSAVIPITVRHNLNPTVSLTSPTAGAEFDFRSTITLTADAADGDGTITQVRFYRGTILLGTSTQAPYSFTWANVAGGSYNLTARATDNSGAVTTSAVIPITVRHNLAPTVSLTSPSAGTGFDFGSPITLTADAADAADADVDGTITRVRFYRGTTLLGTSTQAPYSFTWTNAGAGSHNLTARATDNGGAETTSAVVPITVRPNQAPTVSLTSPAAGTGFDFGSPITLTADAADADVDGTITRVRFYRDTTLLGTSTQAPYSYTWVNAVAGNYNLTARATDSGGSETTSSVVPITVRPNQVPTVSLTSPTAGTGFDFRSTITLTADAADADGSITRVRFYQGTTLLGTSTQAPYSFTWANVAAGSYSLTARATDSAGAETQSTEVPITVRPNQAPTISLSAPATGSVFNAPASVMLQAQAADTDGSIAQVRFYRGATLLGTVTSAPYTFNWNNVAAGSYTLTAQATDNRGAITTSEAISVSVVNPPNQAPTVALTSPAAGANFTAPASVNLTADAADTDGSIASVAFYNGATLLGTDTSAPYSFSWSNVPAGVYNLTARATDDDGAITTSASVNVAVDAPQNQAPTVALTGPTAGASFTAPASINLTASAADADGTIASVAFHNGATLLGTDTSAPYSFSWTNVPAGAYSITAVATDDGGATTTSAAVSVTVEAPQNQAPTVALTSPATGSSFTAPASINLAADAADTDGSIASVAFYSGAALLGTATSSPYSFNWSDVPAGTYSLTARVTDADGSATTSAPVSVTVNEPVSQGPTVVLTSPVTGQAYAAPGTITLTAQADDADCCIVRVDFYSGTTLLGSATDRPYQFTWSGVPEGAYTLTARAVDDDGRSSTSAPVGVTVAPASSVPTINFTSPANYSEIAAPTTITFAVNAIGGIGEVSRVEFIREGVVVHTATAAPYVYTLEVQPLGYGIPFVIQARVVNSLGQIAQSETLYLTLFNPRPVVQLTSPTANASFSAPAAIAMTAQASDSNGTVERVEFYRGGVLVGTDTTAPYSFNLVDVPAGEYWLSARAVDERGDVGYSEQIVVTVVNTPDTPMPTAVVTSPTGSEGFVAPATFNLSVQAQAPPGRTVREVRYYVNGEFVRFTSSPPFASTWSGSSGSGLISGTYQIAAQVTDSAGVVGPLSSPVSVIVAPDQRPPTVFITSPGVGEAAIAPATLTLTANAQPNTERTLAEVAFYNGATLLGIDTTAPYSVQWPDVPVGTYGITARATDSSGATATSAVRLVEVVGIDQAPTVSILSPAASTSMTAPANFAWEVSAKPAPNRTIQSISLYHGQTLLETYSNTATVNHTWMGVPAGSYTLTAVATDNIGAVTTSEPVNVVVVTDPVPVQIAIGWPAAGEVLASTETRSADAYLQDPQSLVDQVEFLVTHNGAVVPQPGQWRSTSSYRHSYLSSSLFSGGGDYSVVARALDASGQELARSTQRSFSRSTAPSIILQDPANFTEYSAPANVTIRGYTYFPSGVAGFPAFDRVEIFLGQTLVVSNAREGTSSQFAATLPALPVGHHDIRIRAIAADGAASEELRRIHVMDAADPARLHISRPIEGALLPQSGNSIAVGGLLEQWPSLTRAMVEGSGGIGSFAYLLPRGTSDRGLGTLATGNWRTRVVATTNQGATRVSEWVPFTVYRRSITIYSNSAFSSVPTPGVLLMTAWVEDCVGCTAAVEFLSGTTVLARVTEAPYQFNLSTLPVGTHSIYARMVPVDASSGFVNSTARTVTVVANAIPTVSITSPTAGATIDPNQNVSLTATATDADGTIASVDFYSGETLLGTRTTAPFSLVWQPQQAGDHVLTARATDNHGAVGISPAVNVRVGGEPPDPGERETITYIHTNLSGSPLAATNSNGNVVWKENYRAYGERRLGQPGSEGQRQWFHGKEADASTGLQYFGARYYDPAVGRFMGVDPVTFQEGNLHSFNRYAYGNNNPVKYLDPDGRWAEDIVLGLPSMAVGSISLSNNFKQGNYLAATIDGIGLIADTAAVALPGIPGGVGLGIQLGRASKEAAKGLKPGGYSVAFETTISKTGAGTREAHKAAANRDLAAAMSDKEFGKMLSSLGVKPVGGTGTPTGFRWHHAKDRQGTMQLVPEAQHTPGSIFQEALHPGGSGGFAQWGRSW